ncbi:MAG: Npun_F5749 family FMN-dependent PPOX-type flavoprotein [Phormidesmis sp.]
MSKQLLVMPLQTTSENTSVPNETLAPWRPSLARALHRNRAVPFSRYFQLATVQANGKPANRTVVFRGFLANTNRLMVVSDRRSEKTEQISHNANAAVCWYFTKTREQFRLSGQITAVTADTPAATMTTARKQIWQTLSDSARGQFIWPQPKASRADAAAFSAPEVGSQTPSASFCLLLLDVEYVDHLELRGDPQNRCIYRRNDSPGDRSSGQPAVPKPDQKWQVTSVNP